MIACIVRAMRMATMAPTGPQIGMQISIPIIRSRAPLIVVTYNRFVCFRAEKDVVKSVNG